MTTEIKINKSFARRAFEAGAIIIVAPAKIEVYTNKCGWCGIWKGHGESFEEQLDNYHHRLYSEVADTATWSQCGKFSYFIDVREYEYLKR